MDPGRAHFSYSNESKFRIPRNRRQELILRANGMNSPKVRTAVVRATRFTQEAMDLAVVETKTIISRQENSDKVLLTLVYDVPKLRAAE